MSVRCKSHRGFTMLELMAVVAIVGIVSAAAVTAFGGPIRQFYEMERKAVFQRDIASAVQIIKRTGRLSALCRKITAGAVGVECVGYPQPTDRMAVALVPGTTVLRYLKFDPVANVWVELMRFPGVVDFKVCDNVDLAANTCGLTPALNTIGTSSPRFFRFQLTGQWDAGPTAGNRPNRLVYQGAFLCRNPILGNPTITYTN